MSKKKLELNIDVEKLFNSMITNYVQPLFPIFEIIKKEYKETGKCPFCNENASGHLSYHPFRIGICDGYFCIGTDEYSLLTIPINNCPICGEKFEIDT